MSEDLIRANLNLVALLQNLEDLVAFDEETAALTRSWNTAIQFAILRGARSHLFFERGSCRFGAGPMERPAIYLLFLSPGHCNRVFEGRGQPVPLKGLTHISFLSRELPKLFGRLEYYLRPTDRLLESEAYLALNTRMTLNTAAYGAAVLARLDPLARFNAGHIRDGTVLLRVKGHELSPLL